MTYYRLIGAVAPLFFCSVAVHAAGDLCQREASRFAEQISQSQPTLSGASRRQLTSDAQRICLRALEASQTPQPAATGPSAAAEPDGPSWSERVLAPTEEKSGHRRLKRK